MLDPFLETSIASSLREELHTLHNTLFVCTQSSCLAQTPEAYGITKFHMGIHYFNTCFKIRTKEAFSFQGISLNYGLYQEQEELLSWQNLWFQFLTDLLNLLNYVLRSHTQQAHFINYFTKGLHDLATSRNNIKEAIFQALHLTLTASGG